jgi:hypothetical protein
LSARLNALILTYSLIKYLSIIMIYLTNLLPTFLISLLSFGSITPSSEPISLQSEILQAAPPPSCNIKFTAPVALTACGTNTNATLCTLCPNPSISLTGVEITTTNTYAINVGSVLQLTNTTANSVSPKIRDGNGLLAGFTIPAGMTLVIYVNSNCTISTILC